MKSEFVYGNHIYKEIEKEEVIFFIDGGYSIFVITKDLQREILAETKHFTDIIPYGMIFDGKNDDYQAFLDAMSHYFNNAGISQRAYARCYYYAITSMRWKTCFHINNIYVYNFCIRNAGYIKYFYGGEVWIFK